MTGPSFQRAIRTYVDTSVFGGCFDDEFAEYSNRFFERVRRGEILAIVSTAVSDELERAPSHVQALFDELRPLLDAVLPLDDEVVNLANAYIDAGVLQHSSLVDALHVAAATLANVDLLVSWNFRHIVNFHRIHGFGGVNTLLGLRSFTILSPREACDEESI